MSIPNPFLKIRKAAGATSTEMAIMVGCPIQTWSSHECGDVANPSPRVLDTLKAMGYDPVAVTAAYLAWREEMRQELLRQYLKPGTLALTM